MGAVVDDQGVRTGEARLDQEGRVLEVGTTGSLGPLGADEVRVHGLLLPRAVNGHTHVGDAMWTQEPPHLPFEQVVAPPNGLKHRLLTQVPPDTKVESMRRVFEAMAGLGTSATIDFREEGAEGVALLRRATEGSSVKAIALGRPRVADDRAEIARLLRTADGLGLSALRDLPPGAAEIARDEVRKAGRLLALHASESSWEPIDPVLALSPDLLVHLCYARPEELDAVKARGTAVAVCPRSNALYQRAPPIPALVEREIAILLGTDNAMFGAPDLFREMEFAYLSCRARGTPVPPQALVEAAFVTPWKFLHRSEEARLEPGSPARTLVLRLPPDDPYYQIAVRGAHRHLLVPGPSAPRH